mgnify:CR=1 FL=1
MLFIRASLIALLAGFVLVGCQSTQQITDSGSSDPIVVVPERVSVVSPETAANTVIDFSSKELGLAEQMFNAPNLYLTSNTPLAPHIKAQFIAATKQLKQGQVAAAKLAFDKLTEQAPSLSGPWLKLGDIALARSEPAMALTHFKQALAVNPNNYVASSRIASLLREQGDFDGARQHYEKALKAWPGLVSAHINLGILYDLYLGNKEDALAHYKLAQKLNELDNKPVNKQLKIWIIDVGRQLKARAKRGG